MKPSLSYILLFLSIVSQAAASSIKMDFLPFADVRTDPIINPTTLSDHVHTFYGGTASRPETTYEDLRSAYGGSGDVEENQSLYWHPTVYKVGDDGMHRKAKMYIGSAYYIWTPGATAAFPNGFKMIARVPEEEANGFFEDEAEPEFESEIWFPDCWDGTSIDSEDHTSHVAYSSNRDVDGTCPDSHPVKIPKIEFFMRIAPYEGGRHIFSDGSTRLHADYFSGWDENELQNVLDNCDNGSFESAPDQFCEEFLTFKDLPKVSSACGTLKSNLRIVQQFQPPQLDTSTITTELIDNVRTLPLGEGTGTLIPRNPGEPVATLAPSPVPPLIPISGCDSSSIGNDNEDDAGNNEEDETGDEEGDDNDEEGNGEGEGEGGGEDEEEDNEGGEEDESMADETSSVGDSEEDDEDTNDEEEDDEEGDEFDVEEDDEDSADDGGDLDGGEGDEEGMESNEREEEQDEFEGNSDEDNVGDFDDEDGAEKDQVDKEDDENFDEFFD